MSSELYYEVGGLYGYYDLGGFDKPFVAWGSAGPVFGQGAWVQKD